VSTPSVVRGRSYTSWPSSVFVGSVTFSFARFPSSASLRRQQRHCDTHVCQLTKQHCTAGHRHKCPYGSPDPSSPLVVLLIIFAVLSVPSNILIVIIAACRRRRLRLLRRALRLRLRRGLLLDGTAQRHSAIKTVMIHAQRHTGRSSNNLSAC